MRSAESSTTRRRAFKWQGPTGDLHSCMRDLTAESRCVKAKGEEKEANKKDRRRANKDVAFVPTGKASRT